jgi:hypothetical protein
MKIRHEITACFGSLLVLAGCAPAADLSPASLQRLLDCDADTISQAWVDDIRSDLDQMFGSLSDQSVDAQAAIIKAFSLRRARACYVLANAGDPESKEDIVRDMRARIESRLADQFLQLPTPRMTDAALAMDAQRYYAENQDEFLQPERLQVHMIFRKANDDKARERELRFVDELKNKATSLEEFKALATKHSNHPSRLLAGDLGFLARAELPGNFGEGLALAELDPDSLHAVTRPEGIYLFWVNAYQAEFVVDYADVEDRIFAFLRSQHATKATQEREDNLRANLESRGEQNLIEKLTVEPQVEPREAEAAETPQNDAQ